MGRRAQLVRNLFWLASATGGSLITSLLYGLLAGRLLGPADFGRFSLIAGIGALTANLAQGAGSSVLTVLAAQSFRQPGDLLLPGVLTQALVGLVCLAVSVPLVLLLGGGQSLITSTVIYCVGSACSLVYSAPVAIFRGLNRTHWSIAQTVAGVLTLCLMWLMQTDNMSLMQVVSANAAAQIIVLALVLLPSIRALPPSNGWHFSRPTMFEIMRRTMGMSGVTAFQAVHWKIGLIVVQVFGGAYTLGMYTAGAKPVENLRMIPIVLLLSMFPAVSQLTQGEPLELRRIFLELTRLILLFMLPIVGALLALAPLVVSMLYGSGYADATSIFSLALLAVVPGTLHLILIMPMVVRHEIKKLSGLYMSAIVLEVGVDAFLYFKIGFIAAVVGAFFGALVTVFVADRLAFGKASILQDPKVAKLLAAGAVSLAIPFTTFLGGNRWMLCFTTVGSFLTIARATNAYTFTELLHIKNVRESSQETNV